MSVSASVLQKDYKTCQHILTFNLRAFSLKKWKWTKLLKKLSLKTTIYKPTKLNSTQMNTRYRDLQYRHCYSYMEVHSSQIHTHAYTKGKTFTFIYFHFLKTYCETLICSLDYLCSNASNPQILFSTVFLPSYAIYMINTYLTVYSHNNLNL